jgi:hypothetical protein
MILTANTDYSLNRNNKLKVMEKCSVFFEVRTECLSIIWSSLGFRELKYLCADVVASLMSALMQEEVSVSLTTLF